jgi:hypothetical protein
MATVREPALPSTELQETDISTEFLEDLRCLARHYTAVFFRDKIGRDGKAVPPKKIYTQDYLSEVMNLEMEDGITRLYTAIGVDYTPEELREFERNGQVADDIKLMIRLLRECAKLGIPKCFASGILCIWAEQCQGKKVNREVECDRDEPKHENKNGVRGTKLQRR